MYYLKMAIAFIILIIALIAKQLIIEYTITNRAKEMAKDIVEENIKNNQLETGTDIY
jgi:hypothetical protein